MRRLVMLGLGLMLAGMLAGPACAQKSKKVDELIKDLDSKNDDVRINALADIGKLAEVKTSWGKMALPQVLEILNKDPQAKMRSAALACLGKIQADPGKYCDNMMKYLKEDKDFGVKGTALALLAQYQQEAGPAVEPLKAHLAELRETNKDQDPGNLRSSIMGTLTQINQGLQQPLGVEALQKDKAASVKGTGVAFLTQVAQQRRIPEMAPLLIKTYEESLKEGPSADLRRGILGALARIQPDPKSYQPLLIETLKKDKDSATVVAVIAALGRGKELPTEAIPLVLDAQKSVIAAAPKDGSDPNGQRRTLVAAVGNLAIDPKQLVPLLVDTLKKDRDLGVKVAALGGLAGLGAKAKEAGPTVSQMAKANAAWGAKDGNDPNDIRRITLETLVKLEADPKDVVAVLSDTVKREKNQQVRLSAIRLLGEVGAPAKSALPLLTQLQKLPKNAGGPEKALAAAAAEASEKIGK
jgi:HEAT repeat protein